MTRYYKSNSALFRVRDHQYCYLDKVTGHWIPDPSVVDAVTGYYGDASTKELTLKQAREWLARNVPQLSVDLGGT